MLADVRIFCQKIIVKFKITFTRIGFLIIYSHFFRIVDSNFFLILWTIFEFNSTKKIIKLTLIVVWMSWNQNWNLNREEKKVLIRLGNCLLLFSTHLLRIIKLFYFLFISYLSTRRANSSLWLPSRKANSSLWLLQ